MKQGELSARAENMLRQAGLRVTRQRLAITEVLLRASDHPDAEQVLARARAVDSSVSQATTYRTLSALADKGLLRSHMFSNGATRFESQARPHHDHIIDTDSGHVIEFLSPEIERLQREIAAAHGYEIIDHRLELYCRKIATSSDD